MLVFIDTEFTDFSMPELISLGMVGELGEECYIETPFVTARCSDFVRNVVIPQLGNDPHAFCETTDLRVRILKWLHSIKQADSIKICYDSEYDWKLFVQALEGRVPNWIDPYLMKFREINKLLLYAYFKNHPNEREHHALTDARANRFAYRPMKR
jgi:hypothetical protein